jgi:poly-gamma-glutamate synthesis protein (capsule biosynthesis protein)
MSRAICLALLLGLSGLAVGQAAQAQFPARNPAAEIATKITAPFTVATVGDIIMPLPLIRSDPRFIDLIHRIRGADVGFANMESSLVDLKTFEGPVTGTIAPIETGVAIKAMGINLMNRANNHTLDGGIAGMVSTDDALDRLGIVHAGTGRNLQDARAPKFLETPKGRVGLIGMFSIEDVGNFGPTYTKTEATVLNGTLGGAAGIDPLHLTTFHVVSAEQLMQLKAIAASYGLRDRASATGPAGQDRFRFFDEWYEAGADPGALHYDMDAGDVKDILASIRNGKIAADFVIATIHAHQTPRYCGNCAAGGAGSGMKEAADHYPPEFLVKLAHESIAAGADMFVTHGVHALAGVEIYRGRPIFYGLSNFVFQFALQAGTSYDVLANFGRMSALQDPATQEALLATSRYENGRLVEVRLYPVDLGGTRRPLSSMGVPETPAPEIARRILAAVQEYSKPFGTRIDIDGGVGVIRVAPGHLN